MPAPTAAQLRAYQAKSRRIQQTLLRVLVAGLVLAFIGVLGGAGHVAFPLGVLVAIVCGVGWWITRGHIEEFEQQLRKVG
jgi:hypothetical protein